MGFATGERLNLRLFLEKVEVPVIGATVTASIGSPATAQIEIIPTDRALYLHARTIVHLFYWDDQSAKFGGGGAYRLLFCGELFSQTYSKSGAGSRNVILQCLDFSNKWDTAYLYSMTFAEQEQPGGTAIIGNRRDFLGAEGNLLDDIVSSATVVVADQANGSPLSQALSHVSGILGGLYSILEILGGTHGTTRGINDWETIHEQIARLLDQISSDNGATAKDLYDSKVFTEWLKYGLGSAGSVMTFRDLISTINGRIYYDVVPNPVATYFPGSRTAPLPFTLPNDSEFSTRLDPEFEKKLARLEARMAARGLSTRRTSTVRKEKSSSLHTVGHACDFGIPGLSTGFSGHALSEGSYNDPTNGYASTWYGRVHRHLKSGKSARSLDAGDKSTYDRLRTFFKALGEEAKKDGMGWGGDFRRGDDSGGLTLYGKKTAEYVYSSMGTGWDPLHVQSRPGLTASDVRKEWAARAAQIDAQTRVSVDPPVGAIVATSQIRLTDLEQTAAEDALDRRDELPFTLAPDFSTADVQSVVQKQAIEEQRERLATQIFRPDVWFVSPPVCNILFPEEYSEFSYSRQMLRETTRLQIKTPFVLGGDGEGALDQTYFAPVFQDIESLTEGGLGSAIKTVIYPHEKFSGIIPRDERMSELNFYGSSAGADEETLKKYAQRTAEYTLLTQRYAARTGSVGGRFLPRVVCGWPMAIINRPTNFDGTVPVHFLGHAVSVSHSVNQGGGRSSVSLSHIRSHRTGDDTDDLFSKSIVEGGSSTLKIQGEVNLQEQTKTIRIRPGMSDSEVRNARRIELLIDLYSRDNHIGGVSAFTDRASLVLPVGNITDFPPVKDLDGDEIASFDVVDPTRITVSRSTLEVNTAGDASVGTEPIEFLFTEVKYVTRDAGSVPIEEAIRPPWIDVAYSNLNIGDQVYQNHFRCASLTDQIDASGVDLSIENAIDSLVDQYSAISQGGDSALSFIHGLTTRPVATLQEVIGAPFEKVGKAPIPPGFHYYSAGPFKNLENLDLQSPLPTKLDPSNRRRVGEASASVETETEGSSGFSHTESATQDFDSVKTPGADLDPRFDRYRRALAYQVELRGARGIRG